MYNLSGALWNLHQQEIWVRLSRKKDGICTKSIERNVPGIKKLISEMTRICLMRTWVLPVILRLFHKTIVLTSELNILLSNIVLNLFVKNPRSIMIHILCSYNEKHVNSSNSHLGNCEVSSPDSIAWTSKLESYQEIFQFQHAMDSF
jgi:hypothetical protein